MLSFLQDSKPNLVAKTVPMDNNKHVSTRISTTVWLWVGITSYILCACGLWSVFVIGGSAAHEKNVARLHAEVPTEYLEWPVSAFAAVLVLNVLNLALRQNATKFRTNLLLLFINGVAFTTDLLIDLDATPVFQASNGRMFHPLRYIQWSHSTPTLIYMIWLSSDPEEVEASQLMYAVVNDIVMILTGLAATCSTGNTQLMWGALSFGTFFAVLVTVYKMFKSKITNTEGTEARSIVSAVLCLMLGLWTLFPVVWLAAELHLISPAMEQLCWGIGDYAAKAVFVSQLWQSNIASVYERRGMALRTWEESNRALVIEKLHGLVDAKERLVKVIGHELRTPMLGIMALSGSLIKEVQQKAPLNLKHLSMIQSSAAFLNNLIDTSLEMATGKNTKPQAAHEAVYMYELVEEVCTLIRPLVCDNVTLSNDVPSELPPVAGDRMRLMQVLFNLVGNASRFTMDGSIHVRAHILDNYVEISVEDTGIGVAQEDIEAIFQPYVSLTPDMASRCGGSGLGLYLVKLALDGHNADINVESEVGKGSAFHFSLPIASDELIAGSPKPPLPVQFSSRHGSHHGSCQGSRHGSRNASKCSLASHSNRTAATGTQEPEQRQPTDAQRAFTTDQHQDTQPGEEATRALTAVAEAAHQQSLLSFGSVEGAKGRPSHRNVHGCLQIMAVNDDVISQVVAEQVIRSQKWKIVKASSGEQCLEYLRQAQVLPDLLLLDNKMPCTSGDLLCQKLRSVFPPSQLAIIIVSVRVEEGDAVQALTNGADDYVSQPYKRSELVARIKAQLRVRDSLTVASLGGHGPNTGAEAGRKEDVLEAGRVDIPSPTPRALMYNSAMVVVIRLLGLEQRLPLMHAATVYPLGRGLGAQAGITGGLNRVSDSARSMGGSCALHQAEAAACACSTIQQLLHQMYSSPIAGAYMQLSATTVAVVVPMGSERQPAVATGNAFMSEQIDSGQPVDIRHAAFALAVSLLKTVSKAQWPDSTCMQAHCVIHECTAKLLPYQHQHFQQQQPQAPQLQSQEHFKSSGSSAMCVLPMLPASEVLLSLGARGFPGCVIATQSAYELLSSTARWLPWLRSPESPKVPVENSQQQQGGDNKASGKGFGGTSSLQAGTLASMGGGPQHVTQAQLYVAEVQGLQYAAAVAHAEAVQSQGSEQQQKPSVQQQNMQQQQQQQQSKQQQLLPSQRQQQPQQPQQLDASQQQALQRVQQQHIKGRQLSMGPMSCLSSSPPVGNSYESQFSTVPPPHSDANPHGAPPNHTTIGFLLDHPSGTSQTHAVLPTSATQQHRTYTSEGCLPAASTDTNKAVSVGTAGSLYTPFSAMVGNPAPGGGSAQSSHKTGSPMVGTSHSTLALFQGAQMGSASVTGPAPVPALSAAAGRQQQQQLTHMQALAHLSGSSATELEVYRTRCKELETENCMLQHQMVDLHAARSKTAMERDLYMRLAADAQTQLHRSEMPNVLAQLVGPRTSGRVLALPEAPPSVCLQTRPSSHLELQLEELWGEAAEMKQEMAALPTPGNSLKQGSPRAAAAAAASPLFNSRCRSMVNMSSYTPNSTQSPRALSPREFAGGMRVNKGTSLMTCETNSGKPGALNAGALVSGAQSRNPAANRELHPLMRKRHSSMPDLVRLSAIEDEGSIGAGSSGRGTGSSTGTVPLALGNGPGNVSGPALSCTSGDSHTALRGTGLTARGGASRESSYGLMSSGLGAAEWVGGGRMSSDLVAGSSNTCAGSAVNQGRGAHPPGTAMALGGRSERHVVPSGGGVTPSQPRAASPLSRAGATPKAATGISPNTSIKEGSGSPDVPIDSPLHKLKRLLKNNKSGTKGSLTQTVGL